MLLKMSRSRFRFCFHKNLVWLAIGIICICCQLPASLAIAQDEVVFDIPAILTANPIVQQESSPAQAAQPTTPTVTRLAKSQKRRVAAKPAVQFRQSSVPLLSTDHSRDSQVRLIQVTLPVTGEIRNTKTTVESFRFDVYWNRISYPLLDYAPRTQTASKYATSISIESKDDQQRGVGLKLAAQHDSLINASLDGQWANNNQTTRRFEEHPQHDVLVASGTSHRGTGAFFRFHPSRLETLEGGRELAMVFCVPESWRCGILKVECKANGSKKSFAWKEEFELGRAYIVPVYLHGDAEARVAATELIQAEQQLRGICDRLLPAKRPASIWKISEPSSRIPSNWVHYLIQSGSDDHLESYRSQLPSKIIDAAEVFVAKRQALLQLSR